MLRWIRTSCAALVLPAAMAAPHAASAVGVFNPVAPHAYAVS